MRTPLPLLAGLCSTIAHAQCVQQSQPPFAGGQFFFSLDDASAAPGGLLKCEGFTAAAPTRWPLPAPTPTTPDFDLERVMRNLITPSCSVGAASPLPDIDALSLGLDWVLATPDGFVAVLPNAWGALTFAVDRRARGKRGSAIELEAAQPDGPGADLFSYVLRGSVLPHYLVGTTVRAHDAAEMGLRGTAQIDALDQFIPMYRMDPAVQAGSANRLSPTPTMYFSVTTATANRVPAPWWANLAPADRTGAVIFQTTWNASARRWGCVQPWRAARDLGITSCEDVDALALEIGRGHLLFSTTAGGCVARDQILYLNLNADVAPPVPYSTHTETGDTTVSNDAGLLGTDDVKAICSLDPLTPRRNSAVPFNVLRMTMATPSTSLTFPGIARTLHGTMFLGCYAGAEELRSYGLGWPDETADAGIAAAFLTLPGMATPPVLLATFARNPRPTYCGDPTPPLTLPIPPHLRLLSPAVRVEISWLALRSSNLHFSQAHPVAIDL